MSVKELNREQLEQLKIQYLDNLLMEEEDRNISYGEMVNINDIVSDELIFDLYGHIMFTDEDFF